MKPAHRRPRPARPGALIETSISRSPSPRFHNSAVIGQGQAGSSNCQRWAISGPEHDEAREVDRAARHGLQELLLLRGEELRDRLLAAGDPLDEALGHRHRERRGLDQARLARVRLDLEVAELAPLLPHVRRIDRPELHRAVVGVADHAAGPRDDPGAEQVESGRVEEVDVALLVVARGEAESRQRAA